MAIGSLFRSRIRLASAIALIGLSYGLFWYSIKVRPILVSTWFRWDSSITITRCMYELHRDFDISSLNLSVPTYVRLNEPRPISSGCDSLVAQSCNVSLRNFTKLEPLKPHEQALIHAVVHRLFTNFSQRGLEIFLAGGSLLGSVRHFGFFPWDADADVMIPVHQKPRARQLLIELSASGEMRFADTERVNDHWQLGIFCPSGHNESPGSKPVPYHGVVYSLSQYNPIKPCRTIVDFFFGNAGILYYTRKEYPNSFPMRDVYPLTLRPFGSFLLPVPRNPDRFLTAVYGNEYELKCLFKYFNHKSYSCADLRSIYPFVTHLRLPYQARLLEVDLLVHGSNKLALFIPAQA